MGTVSSGRQRLSAQDHEVKAVRTGTMCVSMGPAGLVCGNEEPGLSGLQLKSRRPLKMTALVQGTGDGVVRMERRRQF